MFYYLTVARNVADGHSVSLDGRSPDKRLSPTLVDYLCWHRDHFPRSARRRIPRRDRALRLIFRRDRLVALWHYPRGCGRDPGSRGRRAFSLQLPDGDDRSLGPGNGSLRIFDRDPPRLAGQAGIEGLRSLRDAVVLGLLLAFTYWSRLDAILLGALSASASWSSRQAVRSSCVWCSSPPRASPLWSRPCHGLCSACEASARCCHAADSRSNPGSVNTRTPQCRLAPTSSTSCTPKPRA